MYRYSVDNCITYTSEDVVLFKDSPFGCWMERLTLETPDHGIPPDIDSAPPGSEDRRQGDIAQTLRTEGKQVVVVDWDAEESLRRKATLEAMRQGVDFIVDGQLALGSLSGKVNLLMRTSGYSDLGKYLYIPCDTQGRMGPTAVFRLSFVADLLCALQGQLPPQMLLINGAEIVPLQTEDHIYHYSAVKQRFEAAMRDFCRAAMPDPAESARFGRWSECANEVLRQRALNAEEPLPVATASSQPIAEPDAPRPRATAAQPEPGSIAATAAQLAGPERVPEPAVYPPGGEAVSGTLAEQARLLQPESLSSRRQEWDVGGARDYTEDDALQNLEFIGSGRKHTIGRREEPAPQRRDSASDPFVAAPRPRTPPPASELSPWERSAWERPLAVPSPAAAAQPKAHPLDTPGFSITLRSKPDEVVGQAVEQVRGAAPAADQAPPPALETRGGDTDADDPSEEAGVSAAATFSSNLITSDDAFDLGTDPLVK